MCVCITLQINIRLTWAPVCNEPIYFFGIHHSNMTTILCKSCVACTNKIMTGKISSIYQQTHWHKFATQFSHSY